MPQLAATGFPALRHEPMPPQADSTTECSESTAGSSERVEVKRPGPGWGTWPLNHLAARVMGTMRTAWSGASRFDGAGVDRSARPAGTAGRMRHGDVERMVGDDIENAEHERASGRAHGLLQGAAVLKCRLSRSEHELRECSCLHGPGLTPDRLIVQHQRREVLHQLHRAGGGVVDGDRGGVAAVSHRLALVSSVPLVIPFLRA